METKYHKDESFLGGDLSYLLVVTASVFLLVMVAFMKM